MLKAKRIEIGDEKNQYDKGSQIIYTPLAGAREVQDDMEGIDGSSSQSTPLPPPSGVRSVLSTPGKGSTDVDDAPAPTCLSQSKI